MLLREVRRGFSEESQFHFQVTDTALQFFYPFLLRHPGRKRIPRYSLPVRFNPEPERSIIDTELASDLGDRQGVINHLLGGLFLKFRTVPFRFSRHFPVPFPGEILLDPCPETGGHLKPWAVNRPPKPAAMEPAGERPDDSPMCAAPTSGARPQWSRPVNGRTTSRSHTAPGSRRSRNGAGR